MAGLLNFKGSWRSYQKRILDNLNFHLLDKKLHIVAAPGAGKTTLGIEAISRLNQNTLVLVPTNTIKYQWRDRIQSAFLEEKDYAIVSTDIREPANITITTYQALLAAFCGNKTDDESTDDSSEEEKDENSITSSQRFNPQKADEIISLLKKAKITLLCFDEAHHLRKEWWKALMYLNDNLNPNQTLSLTATPPYDVDASEWNRYSELCGEIDEVISIPELVKNGDLCPHQDFVYLSGLKESEKELVKKHSENVRKIINKILEDTELHQYLSKIAIFSDSDSNVEKIYEFPDFYVSVASLLSDKGYKIPKSFLRLFDANQSELPHFDIHRCRAFLNGLLFSNTEDFPAISQKIREYTDIAKNLGLIHNNKIFLSDNIKIQRQIAHSLGKLDSIKEIVQLESSILGKDLRMVILADYIKANDLDNSSLGVVPIWRTLKTSFSKDDISLGVLCGTLILIPNDKIGQFRKLLDEEGLDFSSVSVSDYQEDNSYTRITPKESAKNKIVSLITQMFNQGDLTVLVGTQALLGEGWDAPSINSLILSSTVSSYMLSNQMRGRAIRTDKNNPNKVSNIWHLASVILPHEPGLLESVMQKTSTDEDDQEDSDSVYYDLNQLRRRFEGFEAPSYYGKHEIVNGLSRVLSIPSVISCLRMLGDKAFKTINNSTVQFAKDRSQTLQWWKDALYQGYNNPNMKLRAGVEAPKATIRTLRYTSYKSMVLTILGWFIIPVLYEPRILYILCDNQLGRWIILIWILGFIAIILFFLYKFLKTGTVAGVMKQIGIVMLETLSYEGHIKTSLKNVNIHVENVDEVTLSCSNLQTEENKLFMKCMQEFLDPIDNPRYVLIKRSNLGFINQVDYFSIPLIFSSNKTSVSIFENLWNRYIGKCEIVYTRNTQGRRLLLKARKNAFSAMKREPSKRISKWQ